MAQVDWTVGQVLATLDEMDVADDTLLIVTSDNGSFMHRYDDATKPDHIDDESIQGFRAEHHRANGPLRGTKADVWEAGHRVPFFCRWPGKVKVGQTSSETICLTDILATAAAAAGATFDANSAEDSFSFLGHALISPESPGPIRPAVINHSSGGMFAIRNGKWKLVLGNGSGGRQQPQGKPFEQPYHLFDLDSDLGETKNLVEQNPEIEQKLIEAFEKIAHGDQDLPTRVKPATGVQKPAVQKPAVQEPAVQEPEAGKSAAQEQAEQLWCQYEGMAGPGKGKHIVLIAGDDEYRSEQCMPMLGKILAIRHGFKCTVLFPIDPADGTIKPDHQTNIPGMEQLDSADLVILGLRFRHLPDEQMKHFADYVDAGKPFIGLRTSTHSFNYPRDSDSKYRHYSFNDSEWKGGFGQQVLGDTWISHHGGHKVQSTRGVIAEGQKNNEILRGVTDVWGPSDVYGIRNLPDSAEILLRGQVLTGMSPDDGPVSGKQNDPMMPLAWTRMYPSKSGDFARIFCTTMGASTDFESEGLRRLIVNASYWCLGMEKSIPQASDVDYVDPYQPTEFGFGSYKKGQLPKDFNRQK